MSDSLQSMDSSPPGASVHGILQSRILERVAIPFSRGSSWPKDWTWVSLIMGRLITLWATWEAQSRVPEELLCSVISVSGGEICTWEGTLNIAWTLTWKLYFWDLLVSSTWFHENNNLMHIPHCSSHLNTHNFLAEWVRSLYFPVIFSNHWVKSFR